MTENGGLLVVSPHLDDAVLGCGELLAANPGAVVVTVFAGIPDPDWPLPDWDARCGFESARQSMLARRVEDERALAEVGAQPCWLDFHDVQHRRFREAGALEARLEETVRRYTPSAVALPLGLFHPDHDATHRAALRLLERADIASWLVYEDALYRRIQGLTAARIASLGQSGIALEPIALRRNREWLARKKTALSRYVSQLPMLAHSRPGLADALRAERYWKVLVPATTRGRILENG